jgi:hypothetical protein
VAVQIDIPGIGQVEAYNAASEQTLQQIAGLLGGTSSAFTQRSLNQLGSTARTASTATNRNTRAQNTNTNTISNSSSAMARFTAGYREAQRGGATSTQGLTRSFNNLQSSINAGPFSFLETSFNKLGTMMGQLGSGLSGIVSGGGMVGKVFGGIVGAGFGLIAGLSSVLAFLAKNMSDTNEAFKMAANSGMILGGSILAFRQSAHQAGLTMKDFSAVASRASESLSVFGGTTLEGAREFGRANRLLIQEHGGDMLRMGLSFQDMGVRTADFLANLQESGEAFNNVAISTDSVAAGTRDLALQQKALAAYNGTTLEHEREKQRAARKDAQLNMVLQGIPNAQRIQVQQLTSTFPQFRQFILETMAFGGPVQKESLMQSSLMGATTGELTRLLGLIKNGTLSGSSAVTAMKGFQDNNEAAKKEFENMSKIGVLGIAGSQNSLVKLANQNFQAQFQLVTKSISEVGRMIQEDIGAFERMKTEGIDPLTNAIIKVTKDTNTAQINFSRALTNVYGSLLGDSMMSIIQMPNAVLNMLSSTLLTLSGGLKSANGDYVDSLIGPNQANQSGTGTIIPKGSGSTQAVPKKNIPGVPNSTSLQTNGTDSDSDGVQTVTGNPDIDKMLAAQRKITSDQDKTENKKFEDLGNVLVAAGKDDRTYLGKKIDDLTDIIKRTS